MSDIGRRRKFGEVSYTVRTFQGNDFELIPAVRKMETKHQVEESLGSEFPSIYRPNQCDGMDA